MNKKNKNAYPAPHPEIKTARIKPVPNLPHHVKSIVDEMKAGVWRYEAQWDADKDEWTWKRPPRSPRTSRNRRIKWGKENFESTKDLWGSYEEAYQAFLKDKNLQGIYLLIEPYITFQIDDEEYYIVFFDLDDCIDPDTGEITLWATEIIEALDTYVEVSPSGRGIRIIGFIGNPKERMSIFYTRDGKEFLAERDIPPNESDEYHRAEVYGGGVGNRHLISVTGVSIFDKPIRNVEEWIDLNVPLRELTEGAGVEPEPLDVSDEEILEKMLSSKDGDLIRRFMAGDEGLWEGEGAKYGSRSQADQGFFRKLAFWTRGEEKRMKRIALSSKMRREKWHREDYLKTTIEKAIGYCKGHFYNPQEVLKREFLATCSELWLGLEDPKERLAFGALLMMASDYGYYTREKFMVRAHGKENIMPDSGVWFFSAHRDLGLWLGEDSATGVNKARSHILKQDLIVKISEGKGSKGTLYLSPEGVVRDLLPQTYQHRKRHTASPGEFCVPFYVGKNGGTSRSIYQKMVWTRISREGRPGFNQTQRIVLESVLFGGMEDLDDLVGFLGRRKDKVKSDLIKPLVNLGLLELQGNTLKIPEDFEEALHRIFVESGGEEALRSTQEKFAKEREEFRAKGEEANHERSTRIVQAYLDGEVGADELTPWESNQAFGKLLFAISRTGKEMEENDG